LEILLGGEKVEVDRNGQVVELQIEATHIKSLINSPGFLQPRIPYYVGGFVEGSAAQEAGLQENDQIVAFNGHPLAFFDQFVDSIPAYKGQEISLGLIQDGAETTVSLVVPEEGKIGVYPKISEGYFELSTTQFTMLQAVPAGWNKAVKTLKNYIRQFKVIFNPDTEAYKSVGGFLTIGSQFPSTWDWQFFWNFTAFLSIMLAFLNILPIPALDGGHVVFVLWEMATGRKPNEKVLEYAQIAGFIILVGLLLLANGNDLIKLFFK
jgi:regulator of sigma E protease